MPGCGAVPSGEGNLDVVDPDAVFAVASGGILAVAPAEGVAAGIQDEAALTPVADAPGLGGIGAAVDHEGQHIVLRFARGLHPVGYGVAVEHLHLEAELCRLSVVDGPGAEAEAAGMACGTVQGPGGAEVVLPGMALKAVLEAVGAVACFQPEVAVPLPVAQMDCGLDVYGAEAVAEGEV